MQIHERELPELRDEAKGKKTVLAVGAFDLFHAGHMDYLLWARELAGQDGLVAVLVRTDERVASVKGKGRPVIEQDERTYIVDHTKPVDITFLGPETSDGIKPSMHAARILQPDIVAIGHGWKDELAQWRELVPGVEVTIAPFVHRQSTSNVIRRIRES